MKNNKRAFTIVELVIVIAVIGILAAVLIPTFSSLIEKANMNSDEAAVKSMNTYLSADEQINGKPAVWTDAVKVLSKSGMDAQNYKALSSEHYLVWDSSINRVLYVEKASGQVVYPEEYKDLSSGEGYEYGNWMTLEGQMVADDSWLNQEVDYTQFDKVTVNNDGSIQYDDQVVNKDNVAEKVEGYQSYFGENVAANLLVLEFKNNDTKYGQLKYESNGVEYVVAKVKDSQQLVSYAEYVKKDSDKGENFTLLLTGDIEFNNTQWKPIDTYKGSIDGSYKNENNEVVSSVLKNFNMSDRSAEVVMYESEKDSGSNFYYGFISVFTGDYLGNLTFENVNIVEPGIDLKAPAGFVKDGVYTSVVAGLVTNVAQKGTVLIENIKVTSGVVTGFCRVGGLFGCVGMTKALSSTEFLESGEILIKNCENNATVATTAQVDPGRANAGGIAAYVHRNRGTSVVNFVNCVNKGNVTGVQAGGITGRTNGDTNFIGCINEGTITSIPTNYHFNADNDEDIWQGKYSGTQVAAGIAVIQSKYTNFDNCKNSGTIVVKNSNAQADCGTLTAKVASIGVGTESEANHPINITYSDAALSGYKPTGKFSIDSNYFSSLTVYTQGAEFDVTEKGTYFDGYEASTSDNGVIKYIAK